MQQLVALVLEALAVLRWSLPPATLLGSRDRLGERAAAAAAAASAAAAALKQYYCSDDLARLTRHVTGEIEMALIAAPAPSAAGAVVAFLWHSHYQSTLAVNSGACPSSTLFLLLLLQKELCSGRALLHGRPQPK